jgi:hypothetical protein
MKFKNWLYLENDRYEVYEEAIAAYTFYHFQHAINRFFSDNKKKKIEEYMQEKWEGQNEPNNQGGVRFYIPSKIGNKTILPKEMIDLRICIDINPMPNEDGAKATQTQGIISIHYDPNILQKALSPSNINVQNIIATIQYQLYHEVTHLMSGRVGSGAKMLNTPWWKYPKNSQEYINGQLNYYTDEGEIKAHARQYAIMYMNKYPGQKYNPQTLIKLSQELNDNKMMRYAKKLGDRNIQKQFPQFAQKMQKAHELFQSFMLKFVDEKGYKQYHLY